MKRALQEAPDGARSGKRDRARGERMRDAQGGRAHPSLGRELAEPLHLVRALVVAQHGQREQRVRGQLPEERDGAGEEDAL